MKRQRDTSVESARSSDVPAQETDEAPPPIKLTAKDRAYETVIAAHRKSNHELQTENSKLKDQIRVLTAQGPSAVADETIGNLKDDKEKLLARIKQLETKMNTEIEKARAEIVKLKEQLGSRDTQIRTLAKEKVELLSIKESLEHKVTAAVQESNLQTNLRNRLRENYDNLMREFQRASERGDAFVQKIYTLQAELERVESTKRELVEEVHRLSRSTNSETWPTTSVIHSKADDAEDVDYG